MYTLNKVPLFKYSVNDVWVTLSRSRIRHGGHQGMMPTMLYTEMVAEFALAVVDGDKDSILWDYRCLCEADKVGRVL